MDPQPVHTTQRVTTYTPTTLDERQLRSGELVTETALPYHDQATFWRKTKQMLRSDLTVPPYLLSPTNDKYMTLKRRSYTEITYKTFSGKTKTMTGTTKILRLGTVRDFLNAILHRITPFDFADPTRVNVDDNFLTFEIPQNKFN